MTILILRFHRASLLPVSGRWLCLPWMGLLVRLLEEGPFVKCNSPLHQSIPNSCPESRCYTMAEECLYWSGRLKTNQGAGFSRHKEIQWEKAFPFFLVQVPSTLCLSPCRFLICGGAKGVKVTDIKDSFVPFSQSHRSLLATDLEHDTAISWCHTWVISSCFWNCGLENAALGYFLT